MLHRWSVENITEDRKTKVGQCVTGTASVKWCGQLPGAWRLPHCPVPHSCPGEEGQLTFYKLGSHRLWIKKEGKIIKDLQEDCKISDVI